MLPDRQSPVEQLQNAREYAVEARILPNSPLVGRSIAEVGLRSMKFAFVLDITRGERLVTAVSPEEVLQANDRLTFVGVVDAVNELRRIPGILVAEDQTFQLNLRQGNRCLVELVLGPNAPIVGHTVRESDFRSRYLGVVSTAADSTFTIADIPGLIEGAHLGRGLGTAFLRHVERTRVLIHVIDASPDASHEPIAAIVLIANELKLHNPALADKPTIIAINKMDLAGSGKHAARLKAYLRERKLQGVPISARTGKGLDTLVARVAQMLRQEAHERDE